MISQPSGVIARFLLGPAGSGKTHRCLAETRAALQQTSGSEPLLFLTPKQATFQLERQLLGDAAIPGYTRLRILSFERLANFVLDRFGEAPPRLLGESGRLMVLRALLAKEHAALQLFRASARLPGFARELSQTLRELRQHRIGREQLRQLAARQPPTGPATLRAKLMDLARLLEAYEQWLGEQGLQDEPALLDAATLTLRRRKPDPGKAAVAPPFAGLWLDGFAEMTPQELDLLAALTPHCAAATLAFCLESPPVEPGSWLSAWALVETSYLGLHARLSDLRGVEAQVETLPRSETSSRFPTGSALAHLEAHWSGSEPFPHDPGDTVRLLTCAEPEAEVVAAARTILGHVRAGGRFRDVAVILRSLEAYRPLVQRIFQRYEIPCFIDARESVAHHPLAELTRAALRVTAFGWRNEDWFAALKTGLLPANEAEVDELENEALARGWEGGAWRRPLPCAEDPALEARMEALRLRLVAPFLRLARDLGASGSDGESTDAPGIGGEPAPDGPRLAVAVHAFWKRLRVDRTLASWAERARAAADARQGQTRPQVHASVLDQLLVWLRDVALAFANTPETLRAWLTILEAGLANLSVGAIPPALDQVLVGAVDRSRNPELKLGIILGLNEGVFPAVPASARLLTEADRAELAAQGVGLSPNRAWRLGRERYYGYIACTRPSARLTLTHASQSGDGTALNPSSLVRHVQRLLPELRARTVTLPADWHDSVHPSELTTLALRRARADAAREPPSDATDAELLKSPSFVGLSPLVEVLRDPLAEQGLRQDVARQLYGPSEVRLSPSALERFAACPFQFYAQVGLRAAERRRFEADARQVGSFAHAVLARFHQSVRQENRHWRNLTPEEGSTRIESLATQIAEEFGAGVLRTSAQDRFAARLTAQHLSELIGVTIGWLGESYRLDPVAVELRFGGTEGRLPPWVIELGDNVRLVLTGQIDRVDLARDPATGERFCAIIDYKSTARPLDSLLLQSGVQLQLPLYLRALERLGPDSEVFGPGPIQPIGMFYVGLRPGAAPSKGREFAWDESAPAQRRVWQHRGRLSREALDWLDGSPDTQQTSGQFSFPPNRRPNRTYTDPLSAAEFRELLDQTEARIVEFGRRILSGEVRVDPFQKGTETACAHCDHAAVCRIDPWTQAFRRLTPQESAWQVTNRDESCGP